MTDILSGVLPTSDPDTDPGTPDQSEIDEHLVCVERIAVTHDVTTFVLAPRSTRWFYFQPGQYVTITVNLDGQEVNRCYTISSPPTRPDRLTITVKRVPGGPVSNWLHDRLTVGDTVPVTGPLGRFTTDRHPASKYLFLSAGSGITPLMSMTRTIIDLDTEVDVIFVHNARTPDDIIFRRELETIAADHPKVTVVAICEQDSTSQEWAGHRGRLSLPLLRDIAVDLPEREIFTCGPAPYMTAVRSMLDEAGADPARRHEETFSFEDLIGTRALASSESSVPTSEQVAAEVKTFSVELRHRRQTIECDADTTVLQAALRAGVRLPSSCEEGVCGTCKSSLLCGSVDMQHAGGIRPREIAQNKILVCCSKPLEDLIIDA